MVKNGLFALIIHIFISIIAFSVFTFIINNSSVYDNIMAYDIMNKMISVLILIGSMLFYFILGKKYLTNDSKLQSLSVWIVALGGIVFWILGYFLSDNAMIAVSQNVNWALYCLYNAYFFPVLVVFDIENSYYLVPFTIIPSALLWLGLKFNINKNKSASFVNNKNI